MRCSLTCDDENEREALVQQAEKILDDETFPCSSCKHNRVDNRQGWCLSCCLVLKTAAYRMPAIYLTQDQIDDLKAWNEESKI
jgi:hypothetical protein